VEGHTVTGTPRIRGRINVVLNGLVGSRVIAGFSTNLYSRTPQDDIITVTAPSETEAAGSLRAVKEALRPLVPDAVIRLELP
jgi:hypothetical protein